MIQATNSVNTNSYKAQNPNFGKTNSETQKKPSHAKETAVYVASQFAAGAVLSSLLNISSNVIEKLKKVPNKEKIMSFPAIAKSAALMGGMFVLMGVIVNGVFGLFHKNKNQ